MDKKDIVKRKIIIPIASVFVLILFTLVMSFMNSGDPISYIIDSYFPVWIFISVIISHNGGAHFARYNPENIISYRMTASQFKKFLIANPFFLLVANLMSLSSLSKIMSYSNIYALLLFTYLFVIIAEIICIQLLYKNLEKILDDNINEDTIIEISKKNSLYIISYFGLHFAFTLLVALVYYI